jgi:xanthine dehydrogenase YagS FAD-binding subunit
MADRRRNLNTYPRTDGMTFDYHRATSIDDAVSRLGTEGAVPLGGGTDLLVLVEERLAQPSLLVDLRAIPGSDHITATPDGGVRIGASARVEQIANDVTIRERFAVLAQACAAVGTTALRHMGTLGGNLCQRPRCWYFRRGISCLKNGGDTCAAAEGENQYHAILEGGPCHIVHPSDPAVALSAAEAVIEIIGPAGSRELHIDDFFVLPAQRLDRETALSDGEVVVAVRLPGSSAGGTQFYHKEMQRGAWDFALVSLAAVRTPAGNVRIALGGVAPRPWRVAGSVEEDVASGGLGAEDVATLADRAFYDARPLARNGYKVELASALLRRAIGRLLDG